MLLTLLSDTTIDTSRLESFIVGKGVGTLPSRKVGASTVPGCLTSEDEERETWTAKSLRVSITENSGSRRVEAGRKTSAVHVYIGYTMPQQ